MNTRRCTILLFLAAALAGAGGCRRVDRLPRPEAVLRRTVLRYPSVLGYARFRPALGRVVVERLRKGGMLGRVTAEWTDALLGRMEALGRPEGFVTAFFLDPQVFGGSLAFHFEAEEAGSLARELGRDARFQARPGTCPPEFLYRPGPSGARERLLGLLGALGVETPVAPAGEVHLVVEETPLGTLVAPSRDVMADLRLFLEDTDRLSPWKDTGLVAALEVDRFARAHVEEIRRMARAFRDFLERMARLLEDAQSRSALRRMASYFSAAAVEGIKAVKGIRFASSMPGGGPAELRLLAAEGGALEAFMRTLRPGPIPFPDRAPRGLSLRWNADPRAAARAAEGALRFFGRAVEADPEGLDRAVRLLEAAFAADTGRYLAALVPAGEGGALVFLSGVEGGEEGGAFPAGALLDLLRPGKMVRPRGAGRAGGPEGYDLVLPEGVGGLSRGGSCSMVRGRIEGGRFFALLAGAGKEELSSRMEALLPRSAVPLRRPRVRGLPERLSLYVGVETGFFLRIMGYGSVEENELVIRFVPG